MERMTPECPADRVEQPDTLADPADRGPPARRRWYVVGVGVVVLVVWVERLADALCVAVREQQVPASGPEVEAEAAMAECGTRNGSVAGG